MFPGESFEMCEEIGKIGLELKKMKNSFFNEIRRYFNNGSSLSGYE
jgi:hypothetical protein